MAIACNQKAQSQLLLLNDAFPTLPETSSNVIVSCGGVKRGMGGGGGQSVELWGGGGVRRVMGGLRRVIGGGGGSGELWGGVSQ